MATWPDSVRLGVVLYPGFGLLDVAGPLHAFSSLKNVFEIQLLAEQLGEVESAQDAALLAQAAWDDAGDLDLILVPGGSGARRLARDADRLRALSVLVGGANVRMSVSSGACLLGAIGCLDGQRATTAHRALGWAREIAPKAKWVPEARWVDAGTLLTAAGPAAGIDMALHVITRMTQEDVGENIARSLEHDWCRDASADPFGTGTWHARA